MVKQSRSAASENDRWMSSGIETTESSMCAWMNVHFHAQHQPG